MLFFKDTLNRLLTISKTSNKSVRRNVFWYAKVCIFWRCIQYTIHGDKTQIFKKNSFGQNQRNKKCPLFFFHELQLITTLLLIRDFYMSWNARFLYLKLCGGFFIFNFVSFLLKFIFSFMKMHGLFDLKTS